MATDETAVIERVRSALRSALRSEARIRLADEPLRIELSEGALVLEGEVANVAAKKLALRRAAAVSGVEGVIDRLRVSPAQKMGDN